MVSGHATSLAWRVEFGAWAEAEAKVARSTRHRQAKAEERILEYLTLRYGIALDDNVLGRDLEEAEG